MLNLHFTMESCIRVKIEVIIDYKDQQSNSSLAVCLFPGAKMAQFPWNLSTQKKGWPFGSSSLNASNNAWWLHYGLSKRFLQPVFFQSLPSPPSHLGCQTCLILLRVGKKGKNGSQNIALTFWNFRLSKYCKNQCFLIFLALEAGVWLNERTHCYLLFTDIYGTCFGSFSRKTANTTCCSPSKSSSLLAVDRVSAVELFWNSQLWWWQKTAWLGLPTGMNDRISAMSLSWWLSLIFLQKKIGKIFGGDVYPSL